MPNSKHTAKQPDSSDGYDWRGFAGICEARNCVAYPEVEIDGVYYCIRCADEWIERLEAIYTCPELREGLAELWA